jgi:O-antigen ligase/tetratricopeptide (TPR) repeat protein
MHLMQKLRMSQLVTGILYALVVATPLIFWKYSLKPLQIPKVAFFQAGVELALGLWIGLLILKARLFPRRTPVTAGLLIFLGVMVLTSLLGVDIFRSFWSVIDRNLGIFALIHFVLLGLLFAALSDRINWLRFWQTSFWTATLVALFVPLELKWLASFFLGQNMTRPGSTFGNATFMGGYLLFHVFIGLWLMFETRRKNTRWLFAIGILLQIAAIFLAQTAGVIIGLAAGLAGLGGWFLWKGSSRMRAGFGALFLLVLVGGGIFMGTRHAAFWQKVPGLSRAASFSSETGSVRDRLIVWRIALTAAKDRPLLGWGWENFYVPYNAHYNPVLLRGGIEGTVYDKPHNVLLEYLVTGGVVGLLAYLALWIALGYELRRAPQRFGRDWRPFFAAALAAYFVQNLFVFDTIGTYLLFFMVIGFVDGEYAALRPSVIRGTELEGGYSSMPRRLAAGIVFLAFLVPVFLVNVPMMGQAMNYYWGINYFLNRLPEASSLSWQKALMTRAPYTDAVRKDFMETVQQGLTQNIPLPNTPEEIKLAIQGMEASAARHPLDYSYPMLLADFDNVVFSATGDKGYLAAARANEEKALAASPLRQQIYFIVARTAVLEGNPQAAVAAIKKAIDLDPQVGEPHFFYALLSYEIGDVKTGDRELALAKEYGRGPRDANEAVNLATLLGDKKGDYKGAAQNYIIALDYATKAGDIQTVYDIQLRLGIAFYYDHQLENAKKTFQALVDEKVNVKGLAIWSYLQPMFRALGVKF